MKYNTKIILGVIFSIFLIYLIFNLFSSTTNTSDIEIVVSRYAEDIEWIRNPPYNEYPYIVYNKGKTEEYAKTDKFVKEVKLPNVGRESHTYLYHIIENYDNLANLTIFLPGSVEVEHKQVRAKKLFDAIKKGDAKGSFMSCNMDNIPVLSYQKDFELDEYGQNVTNENNAKENMGISSSTKLSDIRPYGEWYQAHFGDKNKDYNCFAANAIFAISKATILDKPKSYYEELIKEIDDHSNPETGHYFERAWNTVFYPYVDGYTETKTQ